MAKCSGCKSYPWNPSFSPDHLPIKACAAGERKWTARSRDMENDCPHFRGLGEVEEEKPAAAENTDGLKGDAGGNGNSNETGKPSENTGGSEAASAAADGNAADSAVVELSEAEKAKLEKKRARLIKKAIKLGIMVDGAEAPNIDTLAAMVKAKSINTPGEEGDDEDGGDAA